MKLSRILLLASLPLVLVGAVLMAAAFAKTYDPAVSNYFPAGSALPVTGAVFALLSLAAGLASALFAKRRSEPFAKPSAPSFATLPTALGALVSTVLLFVGGKPVIAVFFLAAAAFYALAAFPVAKRIADPLLVLGSVAVIALVILNATFYFDMTVEMNAPVKVLLQMGLLGAMVYAILEVRASAGQKCDYRLPVFTALAASLCGISGISVLVVALAQKTPTVVYAAAVPLILGVFCNAAIRVCQAVLPPKETPSAPETTEQDEEKNAL